MAKKKAQRGRFKPFTVDPYTFLVRTRGTCVVDVEKVYLYDQIEEEDDPDNYDTCAEVTLTKTKVYNTNKKRWHVIGDTADGRRAWYLENGRRFRIYVNGNYILYVQDKDGNLLTASPNIPGSSSISGTFRMCEMSDAPVCRYIVQGGVAYKICR